MPTRREFLSSAGALALATARGANPPGKPMRGVFIIMATPYTAAKEVDYDDLAREVDFLDRSGVAGMVWPQMASEFSFLSQAERMRGMEVLARAARGRKPALVLGVQGPNTPAALAYARHAAGLAPDALIAMPPTEARSLDDYRRYYEALAEVVKLPFFIQTTGGAPRLAPPVEMLVGLARQYPHFGYIKEEERPVLERMQAEARQRPPIRAVFSGAAGRGMLYEMRLGFDGTMPGAPYADIYAQIWNLYQGGRREPARDLFSRLMLMINLEEQIPHVRSYVMRKRGVFKTALSRRGEVKFTREAVDEIEFHFAALKPYLRAEGY